MCFRGRPSFFAVTLLALLSACSSARRAAPPAAAQAPSAVPAPRLALNPEIAPVAFRWLADDALLVAADVGPRKLADFGNYLDRAALKVERTRIAVWDDESAWRANSAETASDGFIEHKRAIYLKDPSSPYPVERFWVFGKSGAVVYERDFRSYPLTELD
jgi:hypothetical protein